MNAEWFGARLKELREQAGLTQPALAKLAGMNRFGIAKLYVSNRRSKRFDLRRYDQGAADI